MDAFRVALFDLDGTLLDTLDDLADAVNFALETYGYPRRSREEVRAFVGNGARRLIALSVPEGADADMPFEVFHSYYDAHCRILTRPYDGIPEALAKLKEKYPKAVGWIYSPGTPINYPVMQGKDNAYFVDRLPNGAENAAGSIFMDYRDSADLNDFTHVLYGHNMKNNSMFGTILDYRKDGYFKEHPFMFYFTEDKTYRLELFAGLNTIATSSLYTEPEADKRQAFIDSAFAGSTFSSNVEVTTDDKIIMMSTCSGAVGQINRYVVFAKIVEI